MRSQSLCIRLLALARPVFSTLAVAAALLPAAGAEAGSFTVGTGASLDLGSGALDTGEGDLFVAGALSAGSQGLRTRDVVIEATGLLNGDSARIEVCRNWDNGGAFESGTSTVALVDGCGTPTQVDGDTTFRDLEITTAIGRRVEFTSASTQTVTGSLALLGAPGNLLILRSTATSLSSHLDVQGTGSGDFVDVDDIDASAGNPITLGANSVVGPDAPGWSTLSGPDADGDGVTDADDNCTLVSNQSQLDSNGDGFGNACDPDYNDDNAVGLTDFNHLRSQFGKTSADPLFDADVDSNGDGGIGLADFNTMRSRFGGAPGPAGALP